MSYSLMFVEIKSKNKHQQTPHLSGSTLELLSRLDPIFVNLDLLMGSNAISTRMALGSMPLPYLNIVSNFPYDICHK